MSNVQKHRDAHMAFNARDYDETAKNMRDDIMWTDHGRNMTMKSKAEFVEWLKGWPAAFSDAKVDEPVYIDGGEYTVCMFKGRGTNDGPFGPMPATNKRLDASYCEVLHWGDDGMAERGELYYDTMTILVGLGHMEPPPAE